MTWFSETDPATVFLAVAAAGMFVGSVRFKRVSLSVAGVLCVALACGAVFADYVDRHGEVLSFSTKLGLSLFVSCVALQAGQAFCRLNWRKAILSFVSGMSIVSLGGILILLFSRLLQTPSGISVGLFAGCLTSTPALAEATELFGNAPAVGYALSYCFGLLLVVIFVQVMRGESADCFESVVKTNYKPIAPFLPILTVALIGNLINRLTPVSTTTGILLAGIVFGVLLLAAKRSVPDLSQIRTLGLILFFVGTGFCAGGTIKDTFQWEWLSLGLVTSIGVVLIGYVFLRVLFRLDRMDALTVLCGGMTSTPAISVLHPGRDRLPLYTVSYTGALCALLAWVKLFYYLAERG